MKKLAWTVLSSWLITTTALAGPVETPRQVLVQPGQPDQLVIRFKDGGGGLWFSDDRGESWRMMCNAVAGLSREATAAQLATDGQLLLGIFGGLVQDDGGRCEWSEEAFFEGRWISDIALHPGDPNVVFAITSSGSQDNGIYRREGGSPWQAMGSSEMLLIGRLRVAELPGGGLRFYQSVADGEEVTMQGGVPRYRTKYLVRYSDDGGASWARHELGAFDGSVKLEAVDPSDAQRIAIAVLNEDGDDEVRVSDNAGESFRTLAQVSQFGGLTVAPDGRVWVGDEAGGLWTGNLSDTSLSSQDESLRVRCLSYDEQSQRLYHCNDFSVGFLAHGKGDSTEIFDIGQGVAQLDCGGSPDVVAVCRDALLKDYCNPTHFPYSELCQSSYPDDVGPPPEDAGDPDAGAAPDSGPGDGAVGAGGCSLAGGQDAHGFGRSVMALTGLLWLARRRRRSPQH